MFSIIQCINCAISKKGDELYLERFVNRLLVS